MEPIQTNVFTNTHVVVPSNRSYEQVIQVLESVLGYAENWLSIFQRLISTHASWEDVSHEVESIVGSSGFMIFSKFDQGALLALADKSTKAMLYILGNPLIAIQMLEHNPAVALYVPLRLTVYEDDQGSTFVVYDQPSSLLGQFQNEKITNVAHGLDEKLEELAMTAAGHQGL